MDKFDQEEADKYILRRLRESIKNKEDSEQMELAYDHDPDDEDNENDDSEDDSPIKFIEGDADEDE